MNLKNNPLETIKHYFETRTVLKTHLFGSYFRDEADDNSDILMDFYTVKKLSNS